MDISKLMLSAATMIIAAYILQKKKKLKSKRLWCRKWLLRRDLESKGMAHFLLKELKLEDKSSFKNFTRLNVNSFNKLLQLISQRITYQDTVLRQSISASTRLILTLRFLATGETFSSLSYSFRISVPAVSKIIPETTRAIYEALKKDYLKTPNTEKQWLDIAKEFDTKWNFPFCLGSLDGKHIAFRARKQDGSFYFNYKGFNSIVLLALVDSDYNFLYVDVGCNGRVSDGGVYEKSSLYTAINNNSLNFPSETLLPGTNLQVPYVIIADEAFKLTNRLMKPYGLKTDVPEKVFNYRLSRARRVVENAFGILSNRFRVLQTEINLPVQKVQDQSIFLC